MHTIPMHHSVRKNPSMATYITHRPNKTSDLAAVSVRIQSPWFCGVRLLQLYISSPSQARTHNTTLLNTMPHIAKTPTILRVEHTGTHACPSHTPQTWRHTDHNHTPRPKQSLFVNPGTSKPHTHLMLGTCGPWAAMNLVLLPFSWTWPTGCSHQLSQPELCHTYACLDADSLISAGDVYTRTKTCQQETAQTKSE